MNKATESAAIALLALKDYALGNVTATVGLTMEVTIRNAGGREPESTTISVNAHAGQADRWVRSGGADGTTTHNALTLFDTVPRKFAKAVLAVELYRIRPQPGPINAHGAAVTFRVSAQGHSLTVAAERYQLPEAAANLLAEFERLFDGQLPWPASEDAVQAVETDLGCRLPDDYRAFLQQFEGGRLDARCYEMPGGTVIELDELLSLKQGAQQYWRKRSSVPPELDDCFPIASAERGDLFLKIRGDDRGRVLLVWPAEYEDDPIRDRIRPVADSFARLMDGRFGRYDRE